MSASLAVVVPTRDRALRLRWLLDALEHQTDRDFEVVVVDDASDDAGETAATLRRFAGRLRLRVVVNAAPAGPGGARNAGWRATQADVVAFTDDDCRPAPDWVERLRAAARAGTIVQGRTEIDPDELHVFHAAPHARSQWERSPPGPWAQGCNIAYPRAVLDATGGFDERLRTGEDTDLALRAQAAGARYAGEPAAVVHHAVVAGSLPARVRDAARWQHLAGVVARHPQMRRHLVLGVFWRPSHAWLVAAMLAAAPLARRRRGTRPGRWTAAPRAVAAAGWAAASAPRYGSGPRAVARSVSELPGRLAIDAAELLAAARGSVRYRTLFL